MQEDIQPDRPDLTETQTVPLAWLPDTVLQLNFVSWQFLFAHASPSFLRITLYPNVFPYVLAVDVAAVYSI